MDVLYCRNVSSITVFTFNFEVMSSKPIGLEIEGQRCVGLIQEQVDTGQLNAVPLKHRTQNLSGNTNIDYTVTLNSKQSTRLLSNSSSAFDSCTSYDLSPQCLLFHSGYNFSVDVHVEIKLEAEALLAGVLQREQTHCSVYKGGAAARLFALSRSTGGLLLTQNSWDKEQPQRFEVVIQKYIFFPPFCLPGKFGTESTFHAAVLHTCIVTYISVSPPWLLFHQLHPPTFPLPASKCSYLSHMISSGVICTLM